MHSPSLGAFHLFHTNHHSHHDIHSLYSPPSIIVTPFQDKEANNVKCNTNIKVAEHNHYSVLMVSVESLLDTLGSNVRVLAPESVVIMWVLGPCV